MMENPYRLLDYYHYEDAPFFFGREEEIAKMVGEILSSRLLVLFSPSGSGKTSLINAGVRPELEKMGYRTVYTRMEGEPAAGICKASAELLGMEKNAPGQGLYDFLKQVAHETSKPLVIFLDQFEEFFIVFKDNDSLRRELIEEVAKIKYDEQLPVFLVLSLREDYFVHLHEFRSEIPSIFNNNANIRLGPFTEKSARQVIEEPLKKVGWKLAEGLADRVLADLKGLEKGGTGIEPMTLQLVCGALWQGRGQVEEKVIGQEVYDACGGAEKVFTRYVRNRLAQVPRRQQSMMVKVFEALKTPDSTKRYRSIEDLHIQLRIKNCKRFSTLLGVLAKTGILREEEKAGTCWYEFKHDLLIPEINTWITTWKDRRSRRRFIYGVMPGIILFLILTIYFFIEYNTFYAVFSRVEYSNQEQEIVITRGFNPFRERIETGLFKSEVEDYAAEDRIKSGYKIGFWNRYDWTVLGKLLALDSFMVMLAHLGQEEKVIKICIQRMKDNDSRVRSETARALGQFGKADPVVLQALIEALKDDRNVFVQPEIFKALYQLGKADPVVPQAFIAVLKDDNWSGFFVRYRVVRALGELGKAEPDVIQVLIASLQDIDEDVRTAAAQSLGEFGKAEPEVIHALIAALQDMDEDVRSASAQALGKLGKAEPDVIQALTGAFKDKAYFVRSGAASALGKLGKEEPAAIQVLIAALHDMDEDVRSASAQALGDLEKEEPIVIQVLMEALKDKAYIVRSAAASALGKLGKAEPAVIQVLITALMDYNYYAGSNAATALGELGKAEPEVINALMAALKYNNEYDRPAAAEALGKLGKAEPEVIQTLIASLKDNNEYVRCAAAHALVQLGKADSEVIIALLAALKDYYPLVRAAAAEALGQLGKADPTVVQSLMASLKDYYSDVREQAAEALGKFFRDKPEKELLSYLQDTRSGWRTIGAYALAAKGKASLSPQTLREIDRLKDTDPRPWARLGAWLAYERLNRKQENW